MRNNNILRKSLKDINEDDHINFRIGNKIEKINFSSPKFLQVLFFREFLVRVFEWRKYSDKIRRNEQFVFLPLWICNCTTFRKLPFAYVPQNSCSYKFRRIDRKTPVSKSFFNKVTDLRLPTLLKNELWYKCFHVSFAKFSRVDFLKEHPRWLRRSIYWE